MPPKDKIKSNPTKALPKAPPAALEQVILLLILNNYSSLFDLFYYYNIYIRELLELLHQK